MQLEATEASTIMCTTETQTDDASSTMCTTETQTDDASTTMCTTETQTDDVSSTMCTTETQTDATETNKKEEVPPEDCTSMSSRVHTDAHNQEQPEQQIEEVVEEEAEAMVPPMRPTMVLRSSTRHQTKISSLQQIVKPIKNKKMATQYLKKIINPKGCRGYRYSGKQARAVGSLEWSSGLCPLCLLNIYSRNLEAKIVWTDDASTTMCTTETQTDATESNKKEEVPPFFRPLI